MDPNFNGAILIQKWCTILNTILLQLKLFRKCKHVVKMFKKSIIVQDFKIMVCMCLFENLKDGLEFCLKKICVDVDGKQRKCEKTAPNCFYGGRQTINDNDNELFYQYYEYPMFYFRVDIL